MHLKLIIIIFKLNRNSYILDLLNIKKIETALTQLTNHTFK